MILFDKLGFHIKFPGVKYIFNTAQGEKEGLANIVQALGSR